MYSAEQLTLIHNLIGTPFTGCWQGYSAVKTSGGGAVRCDCVTVYIFNTDLSVDIGDKIRRENGEIMTVYSIERNITASDYINHICVKGHSMDEILYALSRHFSGFFIDFLDCGVGASALIFENFNPIKKRYLDGGCEYTLKFKLAFRGFFGRDIIKNSANRAKQALIASAVIKSGMPSLPKPFSVMTLDVSGLTTDCIDIRSETARYCVECCLTFFGEG